MKSCDALNVRWHGHVPRHFLSASTIISGYRGSDIILITPIFWLIHSPGNSLPHILLTHSLHPSHSLFTQFPPAWKQDHSFFFFLALTSSLKVAAQSPDGIHLTHALMKHAVPPRKFLVFSFQLLLFLYPWGNEYPSLPRSGLHVIICADWSVVYVTHLLISAGNHSDPLSDSTGDPTYSWNRYGELPSCCLVSLGLLFLI